MHQHSEFFQTVKEEDFKMKTYQDFLNRKQPYGTRELKDGEFSEVPRVMVDEPLRNAPFIMNRRNRNLNEQSQSVDFNGCIADPMDPTQTMSYYTAREVWSRDQRATFDGFSVVLPNTPEPITNISGKDYYLVAITINQCVNRHQTTFYNNRRNDFSIQLNSECLGEILSLGSPLWSLNTTQSGIYIFALSEKPIVTYRGKNKSVFSSGGVIAMNVAADLKNPKTGEDLQIEILSPQALKTIEKWRKEATNNAI
jgi:hypothetical protein